MACDKQPSFGSLLEQLIMAPHAMRIGIAKRLLREIEAYQEDWVATHAALVAQVAELTRERDEARATNLTWLAKYNAQRGELAGVRDEVTRLTEAMAAAERRVSDLKFALGNGAGWFDRARAAEARARELDTECTSHVQDTLRLSEECATLRAEVERLVAREGGIDNLDAQIVELRAEVAEANKAAVYSAQREQAAESSLAAANALLERAHDTLSRLGLQWVDAPVPLIGDIRAHLANQPATAPARDGIE